MWFIHALNDCAKNEGLAVGHRILLLFSGRIPCSAFIASFFVVVDIAVSVKISRIFAVRGLAFIVSAVFIGAVVKMMRIAISAFVLFRIGTIFH